MSDLDWCAILCIAAGGISLTGDSRASQMVGEVCLWIAFFYIFIYHGLLQ